MVAYYNRRVFFCAGVVVQQGRRSQETNVPAKPLPPSPCRTQEDRLRITPPSRNEGGREGRGPPRKQEGWGPEGTKSRACARNNLACVSPPFETATALGQREGFVVQDRVGMFSRCRMFFSLSVRLRMVWGRAKKCTPPLRVCSADVDEALSRPARPPEDFARECSRTSSLECGELPLCKRCAPLW